MSGRSWFEGESGLAEKSGDESGPSLDAVQAAYQLLQTEVGGAPDRLRQSEGLTDLGLVCAGIL